jgi:hypothetical protein
LHYVPAHEQARDRELLRAVKHRSGRALSPQFGQSVRDIIRGT